jgi:PAS domain S-box-containing protein
MTDRRILKTHTDLHTSLGTGEEVQPWPEGSLEGALMSNKPTYEELVGRVEELEQELLERKQAESSLQEERDRAHKYLEIAGVILVVLNSDQTVQLINRKGCEVLGYEPVEIIGKNWFDTFLPNKDRERTRTGFIELISGNTDPIEYFENPVLTKNKGERVISWHNTVLTDQKGNIVATLSSGEDITDRKQVEEALSKAHEELSNFSRDLEKIVLQRTEELREKNKQLIEAERIAALGKIANRIAHELRNPLTVVGGFARRVYEKTPENDPNKNYLRIMIKELIVLENRVSEIIKIEDDKSDLAVVNEGKSALTGDLGNETPVKI